jgi:hypothetical protein
MINSVDQVAATTSSRFLPFSLASVPRRSVPSAINEKLLDNQDLCLLFQISPRSLQRYRSLGVLPYKRLGQKTYYTEEDVMQFVENNVKEFKKENVEHYLTRIHQKFK